VTPVFYEDREDFEAALASFQREGFDETFDAAPLVDFDAFRIASDVGSFRSGDFDAWSLRVRGRSTASKT